MRWILLGLALVACRDGSTPTATPEPARASTGTGSAAPPTPAGPRPSLPALADAPPPEPQAIEDKFAAEPIDRFWKTNTEAEIRRRVPNANAIECHRSLCRITLVGNEHELATSMDQLESEQSLRGIAQSVMLTAPDKRPDGTLALRAYARFVHDEPDE